ncbi:hypothetical protein HaLaN_18525, partial [Haematococcus lacustris]
MAWLVRVVLAATTSAGSRLPAPGCPMGLGGSRRGCGLVVVVGQQRDRGRGTAEGQQRDSRGTEEEAKGQEASWAGCQLLTGSWLATPGGREGTYMSGESEGEGGNWGVGDLEVLVMGQGRVRGKGPRGWSVTVRPAASKGHACNQQTRTCMTR